jgi:hypothetical protein
MRIPRLFSRSRTRTQLALAAVAAVTTLSACGDDGALEPDPILGAYTATTFRVTPAGESEIDVLAEGGSLSITIGTNFTTTGSLVLPASVTGDEALQESMAGVADREGNGVQFVQTADTFVRDLNWTVGDDTISVTNQSVGGASFTIVLTR